jgi:iron-sulfur cluster assembly protein
MAVRITEAARTQLIRILRHHKSTTALFSVKGGGCNGLRYNLEPTRESRDPLDEEVSLGGARSLRVCGKSLLYILGTEIDWRDDFMGQTFHFDNPNTASTCGCGSTFSPS